MQHNDIFSTEDSHADGITKMPQWFGWYPAASPDWIPGMAIYWAGQMAGALAPLPQGKRVLFLRQVLRNESYVSQGADPMRLFETGSFKVSYCIQFLRPLGLELRRQGIHLDGVWTDNEAGVPGWSLSPDQLTALYRSPKALAKMPPGVRALRPEMFVLGNPDYMKAMLTFNRYSSLLMYRTLRLALVQSGVLRTIPLNGGPLVQPPTGNFNVFAPTFQCFDYNNWPVFSFSLDGRTSSPACYLTRGGRYYSGPVHAPFWNALVDQINYARSIMRRPGAKMWATIAWPTWTNPWLFEQMIAHWTRTGVNRTASDSAYIYWRDPNQCDGVTDDPMMTDIFSRHDNPYPVQNNLPEVQLDCDSITTGDFTTTYEDFLDHMPWP